MPTPTQSDGDPEGSTAPTDDECRWSGVLASVGGLGAGEADLAAGTVELSARAASILRLGPAESLRALAGRLSRPALRSAILGVRRARETGATEELDLESSLEGTYWVRLEASGRRVTFAMGLRTSATAERNRRLNDALRMAGVGVWAVELATGDLHWSDGVFEVHELPVGPSPTVEEALGFYPPHAAALVQAGLDEAIAKGVPYDVETELVTAKGNRIWVHTRGGVERGPDGEPTFLFGTIRDVTQRHEAEQRVRESEERLKLALEGARDGVWDWDLETNEVVFSDRWKEIIGYGPDELLGGFEEWSSRVPEDELTVALDAVQRCVRGETDGYRAEFRMRHKDGSWRWILARATSTRRASDGKALRIVGTHSDITDQIELRQQLVEAKESAENAAQARSSFLATMSHEIRTPMNGVLGLAELLLDSDLSADQRETVQSIRGSGRALLGILNDVLDLSKAEAGMLELESIPMRPRECADDVVQLLSVQAGKKSLALRLDVADDVPPCVLGDPGRLRQVLLNLVGNAVKFTAKGEVTVGIRMLEGARSTMRYEVLDTGIGIEPEARRRIFEPFTQADASTTRRFGGTGLGLSISRRLAEVMGGSLDCAPRDSGGSAFWIDLPVDAVDEDRVPGEDHDSESFDAGGALALVAEDNPVNQLVSKRLLEKLGFDVTVVPDGLEALNATDERLFDVVFMDCQMPVMDGYESTRRIQERAAARGVGVPPIIALTANALSGDRERCIAAGFDEYVSKPIVLDDVVAAYRRVTADPGGDQDVA